MLQCTAVGCTSEAEETNQRQTALRSVAGNHTTTRTTSAPRSLWFRTVGCNVSTEVIVPGLMSRWISVSTRWNRRIFPAEEVRKQHDVGPIDESGEQA